MKKTITFILSFAIILSTFSVMSFAKTKQEPQIVDTIYETDEIIIADIVLTQSPYNADNTGKNDVSDILQEAINDCYNIYHGGTVFLPAGKYRITKNINILPFVTVHGDWQDPDISSDYGTIIVADVQSSDELVPSLFSVNSSSGAVGLTIWYPNQSLDDVKPYPYTFYIQGYGDSYMQQTIKNCTMLNSYRGIGATTVDAIQGKNNVHEMLTIENVKGTFLSEGLNCYNSADVNTGKTFYLSPKYWANAGEEFNAPKFEDLAKYTKQNATALILGDIEWPEYSDFKIEYFKYGIHFVKGVRVAFSGTFTDLSITKCQYGIYADEEAIQSRCGRQWGIAIYNSEIEGSKLAIYDVGKNVSMLTNVKVKGLIIGQNIHIDNNAIVKEVPYNKTHKKPNAILYVVNADKTGLTDASQVVSQKLDEASKTGGVVYLPGGLYRFDNPITIPANVELRGASSVASRDISGNSSGTLIISYYGYLDENENVKPLITLNGENAGISGIRVSFVKNNIVDDSGNYKNTSSAFYICADNCYAINCNSILCSKFIEIENCNNIFLEKNIGCAFESMISIKDCNNVFVERNHQNATCITRNGYRKIENIPEMQNWITEKYIFINLFIPILMEKCSFITVENSKNVTLFDDFIYGGKSFLTSKNSECLVFNSGCDGNKSGEGVFILDGGDTTVINFMRSIYNYIECWGKYTLKNNAKLTFINSLNVAIKYNEFNEYVNRDMGDFYFIIEKILKVYTLFGIYFTKNTKL